MCILEAGLLSSNETCYNWNNFNFLEDELLKRLNLFSVKYSGRISKLLAEML